ncbi:MAG: AAA family ATPase [Rhodocyclaceae bacterium]
MRVILTGGPGAGKTSLLHELHKRGLPTFEEAARSIIKARRAIGLPSRPSAMEFAEQILRADIDNYERAEKLRLAFFDRGIPDALAMMLRVAPARHGELVSLSQNYAYYPSVFSLPPWEEIYANDDERDQTYEEAGRVYDELNAWYRACGYTVIVVPKISVSERADFVLGMLRKGNA